MPVTKRNSLIGEGFNNRRHVNHNEVMNRVADHLDGRKGMDREDLLLVVLVDIADRLEAIDDRVAGLRGV